jgi:hypothetical protein
VGRSRASALPTKGVALQLIIMDVLLIFLLIFFRGDTSDSDPYYSDPFYSSGMLHNIFIMLSRYNFINICGGMDPYMLVVLSVELKSLI